MSRLSEHSHTSGTFGYMIPQQADGQRPHVTDDIYSLSATLYELLTSTPPFIPVTSAIKSAIKCAIPRPSRQPNA